MRARKINSVDLKKCRQVFWKFFLKIRTPPRENPRSSPDKIVTLSLAFLNKLKLFVIFRYFKTTLKQHIWDGEDLFLQPICYSSKLFRSSIFRPTRILKRVYLVVFPHLNDEEKWKWKILLENCISFYLKKAGLMTRALNQIRKSRMYKMRKKTTIKTVFGLIWSVYELLWKKQQKKDCKRPV